MDSSDVTTPIHQPRQTLINNEILSNFTQYFTIGELLVTPLIESIDMRQFINFDL